MPSNFNATNNVAAAGLITGNTLASGVTSSSLTSFGNSPVLVTPDIGTPSAGTLTNCSGLPISTGVSGLGSGVATFLATPSSANLASALTTKTGTGNAVFDTSPTFQTALNLADGATLYTGATSETRGSLSTAFLLLKGNVSGIGDPAITFYNTGKSGAGLGYYFSNTGATGNPDQNSLVLSDASFTIRMRFPDGPGEGVLFSSYVKSTSPTQGIGYADGAGGSATQSTSKTTEVTLNKVSGRITMSNSSLAAGEKATFNLTNSTITSSDTVSISIAGGEASDGSYQVLPVKVASGSCKITVQNVGAVTLSEALVLQFNVHKGAIS